MLLVVPNGKVKLLNALPFAPADLRRDSLETAWQAYREAWRTPEVREFVARCRTEPALLRHANETWAMSPGLMQPQHRAVPFCTNRCAWCSAPELRTGGMQYRITGPAGRRRYPSRAAPASAKGGDEPDRRPAPRAS